MNCSNNQTMLFWSFLLRKLLKNSRNAAAILSLMNIFIKKIQHVNLGKMPHYLKTRLPAARRPEHSTRVRKRLVGLTPIKNSIFLLFQYFFIVISSLKIAYTAFKNSQKLVWGLKVRNPRDVFKRAVSTTRTTLLGSIDILGTERNYIEVFTVLTALAQDQNVVHVPVAFCLDLRPIFPSTSFEVGYKFILFLSQW